MAISLQNMSLEEKLQTMELLWEDLRAHAGDALSPAWHGEELARREAALARGDETAEAWEKTRQRIRDSVR